MKKPTLNELMEKSGGITRYSLVIGIAKRAREIQNEAEKNGDKLIDRPVMIATDDIVEGRVRILEK